MLALFRRFSFPGGIGSHCTPELPGSIHEGGELGYVLSHACGAAFDNPDLIVAAVVGDGEAETGPLATSWHVNKFLNPARDGAVLPILNLNGYKINNPTLLARITRRELEDLLSGFGWVPHFVEGSDPPTMHQAMAATLDKCVADILEARHAARDGGPVARVRWPMIVLRTPKGWTAPAEVDGHKLEGSWRAHQVPIPNAKSDPRDLALLEQWMRSYRPEELFTAEGAPVPALAAYAPQGARRMGRNPHANGGTLKKALQLPDFRDYAVQLAGPGVTRAENTHVMGEFLRDVMRANMHNFRVFGPDENTSNKLTALYDVTEKLWLEQRFPEDDDGGEIAADGRVVEMLSRTHARGDARRLPPHRSARPPVVVRGVRARDRLDVQPAREVARRVQSPVVAGVDRVAQPARHVHRVAAGPQRLHAPGSRLPRHRRQQEPDRHPHLPAARRELPAVGHRPLPAQPEFRQRHRRRQAAAPAVPVDRRCDRPLHEGHRHLAAGEQRRRAGARRGDGERRRRHDAGGAGRHRDAARRVPRLEAALRQRRGPLQAAARHRSSARIAATATSTACSRSTSR